MYDDLGNFLKEHKERKLNMGEHADRINDETSNGENDEVTDMDELAEKEAIEEIVEKIENGE